MQTTSLACPWPGRQPEALEEFLPLLHSYLLLARAICTDPRACDGSEDLAILFSQISSLPSQNHLADIRKFVSDKKRISYALRGASAILSQTRVSGNAETKVAVSIGDFELIKRISAGAFARVFLARKKVTNDIYAIKVIPKSDLVRKNQLKRVLLEKDILLSVNSDFITRCYYSIIGPSNLYIVMEYLPGGDLYSMLQNLGCLDEDSARVYAVQIAMALAHLHSLGIIHRDLKPHNILVSKSGGLKLTDFGLSYVGVVDRQYASEVVSSGSCLGTPDYIAPEILLLQSHTFTVDWWSFGVIVYEFLAGVPPFHGANERETHLNTLQGLYQPLVGFSTEACDFVSRLLILDPSKRLGAGGSDEVLKHPWLQGAELESPFVPELNGAEDTQYFTERYTPQGDDDSDIFKDVEESRKPNKLRKVGSQVYKPVPAFDIRAFSPSPSEGEDSSGNSEMNSFPSVQVVALSDKNKTLTVAQGKVRRSSFAPEKTKGLAPVADSPLASRSFMEEGKRVITPSRMGLSVDDSTVPKRKRRDS
jgi:serine/threonine protein kinase